MVTQEVELPLEPVEVAARCAAQPMPFALDGGGSDSWGDGSAWLSCAPRAVLQIDLAGVARLTRGENSTTIEGDPFTLLEEFHRQEGSALLVVALSYDLRRWVESVPSRHPQPSHRAILHAAAYDWALGYDYATRRYRLHCAGTALSPWRAAWARITELTRTGVAAPRMAPRPVVANFDSVTFANGVRRALDYIGAGDVYQINLAQRFTAPRNGLAAIDLYRLWQGRHPMPFAAFVDGGDFQLVSNSPECLLRVRNGTVSTHPIKGTRPRGADTETDAQAVAALRADPKERAEHVMIVDLERNDLGKVCRYGTVHVDDLMQVATYPSLHHLVSTVTGRLRPEVGWAELLRAVFPGGSITGAPKIRAMEIIDEIETTGRGFYTGAIGLMHPNGDGVFNIAIRTATLDDEQVSYHAGGGLVADSQPDAEYAETILKARAFLAAMGASDD